VQPLLTRCVSSICVRTCDEPSRIVQTITLHAIPGIAFDGTAARTDAAPLSMSRVVSVVAHTAEAAAHCCQKIFQRTSEAITSS
jgi:formylmethanofuran dehydrogenase subunit B